MQRGQDKMPSERSLNGNFCCFEITNLTHQNCVGILAQESAQCRSKIQADRFFHLDLIDAGKLELDGIFRSHDVGVRLVEQ